MPEKDWTEIGAVRAGRNAIFSAYASWPFGRLTLTDDTIKVSYPLGCVTLQRREISGFEVCRWLIFWKALRIRHLAKKAPPFVVFWSSDLRNLINELQHRGFESLFDTSGMSDSGISTESREYNTISPGTILRPTRHPVLLMNLSFYVMLTSFLILETPSKPTHLLGGLLLISAVFLFLFGSLQLGLHGRSISPVRKKSSLVVNASCLLPLFGYALILAVKRERVEYWLQFGVFVIGLVFLVAVAAWNRRAAKPNRPG